MRTQYVWHGDLQPVVMRFQRGTTVVVNKTPHVNSGPFMKEYDMRARYRGIMKPKAKP